ncbi:MAG: hypothetical protein GX605_10360 [Chloroflexi bacterium]|nr:hypothetical protein [Chloroflexota bacterium]
MASVREEVVIPSPAHVGRWHDSRIDEVTFNTKDLAFCPVCLQSKR